MRQSELPQVLWTIHTKSQTSTGKTSFSITYGIEAMHSVEAGLPLPRLLHFNEVSNDELRRCKLDLLEEMRNDSQVKLASYQRKMTRYFNEKIKKRSFHRGELVLRKVFLSSKEPNIRTLGPSWEDP